MHSGYWTVTKTRQKRRSSDVVSDATRSEQAQDRAGRSCIDSPNALSPLSFLDNSQYDTLFVSSKRAYLRHFRSSISEGVQLGQVAIYCRVSTDDQCCERQERDLRAFARRAGHRVVGVFKETASGS
jgi:Resolvase, N terminal domain